MNAKDDGARLSLPLASGNTRTTGAFHPSARFRFGESTTMIVNGYTFSYRNLDIRAAVDDRAYVVTMTATLF